MYVAAGSPFFSSAWPFGVEEEWPCGARWREDVQFFFEQSPFVGCLSRPGVVLNGCRGSGRGRHVPSSGPNQSGFRAPRSKKQPGHQIKDWRAPIEEPSSLQVHRSLFLDEAKGKSEVAWYDGGWAAVRNTNIVRGTGFMLASPMCQNVRWFPCPLRHKHRRSIGSTLVLRVSRQRIL